MQNQQNQPNQKPPTLEERVQVRAYQLSLEDPSRTPEENWRLAERQLLAPCQPTLRCFLLVVLLAFLVFLVLGLIYQTMLRDGQASWQLQIFYYVLVAAVALFLVHLVAESRALQQGLLWPFIGLVTAFRREGKTFWDFLELIGGAALLGLIASVISFFVTQSNQRLQETLQRERENQQLLVDYVKDITSLLDGEDRDYEKLNDDLRISISTRTLNTIQALSGDPLRQGDAIRFASRVTPRTICESGKVDTRERCSIPDNIPVKGVTLRNFHIDTKGDIPREFFQQVDLSWSNFQGSAFETADLYFTSLRGADLSATRFTKDVQLHFADFSFADLAGAQFVDAKLACVEGLESARYDETVFSIESLLSVAEKCRLDGQTRVGIPQMCLYTRNRRVVVRTDLAPDEVPAEKMRALDKQLGEFREAFKCELVPSPDALSWHQQLVTVFDPVRLGWLDLRWWLARWWMKHSSMKF